MTQKVLDLKKELKELNPQEFRELFMEIYLEKFNSKIIGSKKTKKLSYFNNPKYVQDSPDSDTLPRVRMPSIRLARKRNNRS